MNLQCQRLLFVLVYSGVKKQSINCDVIAPAWEWGGGAAVQRSRAVRIVQ